MLTNFYLFITPLVAVFLYILFKFVIHRQAIQNMSEADMLENSLNTNNLEEAKEKVFVFADNLRERALKTFVIFLHWVLHFFVIFLKLVSDMTTILYSQARDFFLRTATKEKGAVAVFWHHLKEYKKEKESEQQDSDK